MANLPIGKPLPNWVLTRMFGKGLPGFFDMGARLTEPPYDLTNEQYVKEYPVWQPGAFTGISPPTSGEPGGHFSKKVSLKCLCTKSE